MIEIDEVLVAISASGRSVGSSCLKICFLTSSFSVAASITMSQSPNSGIVEPGRDARHRRIFFVLADPAARDLAGEIAVDRVAAALHRLLADVGHHHVEPGERADMRDAAAHLPGTDDADPAQPASGMTAGEDAAALTGGASSSSASSGRTLNRSPTSP